MLTLRLPKGLFEGVDHRDNDLRTRQQIARRHAVFAAQCVVNTERLFAAVKRAFSLGRQHRNLPIDGVVIGAEPGF